MVTEIEKYIDKLLPSDASLEMKQEILSDALAHFNDLIKQGYSEKDAYSAVIEQLGSFDSESEKIDAVSESTATLDSQEKSEKTEKSGEEKMRQRRKILNRVETIFNATFFPLILVIYLSISFSTHAWSVTWLIFIIAICVSAVLDGALTLAGKKEEGVIDDDKDEN